MRVVTLVKMLRTYEAQSKESTTNFDHCTNVSYVVINTKMPASNKMLLFFCLFVCLGKVLRDTLTRAALDWTLFDNDKLANRIARLVAIVVIKLMVLT